MSVRVERDGGRSPEPREGRGRRLSLHGISLEAAVGALLRLRPRSGRREGPRRRRSLSKREAGL